MNKNRRVGGGSINFNVLTNTISLVITVSAFADLRQLLSERERNKKEYKGNCDKSNR
jgi:hypothetical protein